jgi:hypothetical protein
MTPEQQEQVIKQMQAEMERATEGMSPLEATLFLIEAMREADPEGEWKIEAYADRFRIVPKRC